MAGRKWSEESIRRKVAEFERGIGWYQDIELGNGIHTKSRMIFGEEIDHPKTRFDLIAPALPADLSGLSVLDIGCNAGFFALEAKSRGADYVCGIDIRQEYIDQARFCAEVRGLDIDYRLGDVVALGVDRHFDIVLFVGILYHCRYLMRALDELSRVAKDTVIVETAIYSDRSDVPLVRYVGHDRTLPGWWHPNMAALRELFSTLGFSRLKELSRRGGRAAVLVQR